MTADHNNDGDQPLTVAAAENDATTIVPPPTEAAPDLAWSSEDETEVIPRQSWGLTWGRAAVLLAATGVVALAVGFGGWALVRMHDESASPGPVTNPPTSWAGLPPPAWMTAPPTPQAPASAATTAQLNAASMPGTDDLGWTAYPHARCDSGTRPAVMGRTTLSVLVVCQIQPGSFYYRGVRLSDGASIELPNAVRSSDGFDVTNPVDGTRYQVRQTGISITSPDGQMYPEPMINYWAS
jgi:hypothetical protein